jgi:hypothetical protein
MMQFDWQIWIEQIAILILLLRLFLYAYKDQNIFYNEFEIALYIVVMFINNLLCSYWPSNSISFYFFHTAAPISVTLGVTLRWLKLPFYTLFLATITSAIHLYFSNYSAIVILYILAILSLLLKSIKLARRASKEIRKSSVYVVLAIDLMFSLKVFVIANESFDWKGSVLIGPMWSISLIMFTLTIIVLHVKLRRFFIA